MAALLLAAVVLGGCPSRGDGPNRPTTAEERNASIVAIADQFAATQDLEAVQEALTALDLPAAPQAVLALTESYIAQGQDSETTFELANLAKALGMSSRMVGDFVTAAAASGADVPVALAPPATNTPVPADTLEPTATSTDTPAPTDTPTDTPEPSDTPTETPVPRPVAVIDSQMNVRGGPGTNYPILDQAQAGDELDITARSQDGQWWQVTLPTGSEGWLAASLVTASGSTDSVQVAQNVAPPPTPRPTNTPAAPAAPPTATSAPQPSGPQFKVAGVRLWGVEENGGYFDGPSVHCGGRRDLWVYVVDTAGNRIDGVTIKSAYDPYEEDVTGSKGPGAIQMVLGEAKEVYVIRNQAGQEITSDRAFVSTMPRDIPDDQLIAAGYCRDASDCAVFRSAGSCKHHYSWDVIFQKN